MTIMDDLRTILREDDALTLILPGGIFATPLNPDDPVTGAAWQPHPVTGIKRLLPCLVVLDPQEVDSPFGRNPGRRLDTDLWPELVFYARRGDVTATFEAADERAMALLHDLRIGTADVAATGYRARPLEADELPGNVMTIFRRYRVQRSRHIAEV